jgi:uncharacterized protein involved in outer membrane biogenesis
MDSDASGWLWVVIDILLPVVLLAAIVYGTIQWKKRPRDRSVQQLRDDTTRENYRREEAARRG